MQFFHFLSGLICCSRYEPNKTITWNVKYIIIKDQIFLKRFISFKSESIHCRVANQATIFFFKCLFCYKISLSTTFSTNGADWWDFTIFRKNTITNRTRNEQNTSLCTVAPNDRMNAAHVAHLNILNATLSTGWQVVSIQDFNFKFQLKDYFCPPPLFT